MWVQNVPTHLGTPCTYGNTTDIHLITWHKLLHEKISPLHEKIMTFTLITKVFQKKAKRSIVKIQYELRKYLEPVRCSPLLNLKKKKKRVVMSYCQWNLLFCVIVFINTCQYIHIHWNKAF